LKILLDHNLDRRLKDSFSDYDAATTQEQNWADALNGELLTLAETNGFDVLLTADTNIKSQQNLAGRNIAILILRAFNNRLTTHREMIEDINSALLSIKPGEIVEVIHIDVKSKLNR
jgi:predicted nuclease of predicted toxin-antitoxin system